MSPAPNAKATASLTDFDPAKLVTTYIDGITAALANEQTINAAVRERQTIINDPSKGSNNRGTLADNYDQFDNDGMIKKDAKFVFHAPVRVKDEQERYTRSDMSDFEKIAFTAAYFKVGSDMFGTYFNSPQAMKCLDVVQLLVANQLAPIAGFTQPRSYQVNELVTTTLNNIKEHAVDLGKKSKEVAEFNEKLQATAESLIARKQEILKRATNKNPATLKPADLQKHEIIVAALTAIGDFGKNYDMRNLSFAIATIAAMDHSREKGNASKHKTSELITGLTDLIKNELSSQQKKTPYIPSPTKTLESSLISRKGNSSQFFKAKQSESPTPISEIEPSKFRHR